MTTVPTPAPLSLRHRLMTSPADALLLYVQRWATTRTAGCSSSPVPSDQPDLAPEPADTDSSWWNDVRRRLDTLKPWGPSPFGPPRATSTGDAPPPVTPEEIPGLLNDLLDNPALNRDPDVPEWAPILRILVEQGARLDALHEHGHTAITRAVFHGMEDLLLQLPTEVLVPAMVQPGGAGDTAWHLCMRSNHLRMVTALLERGLDPMLRDGRGNTPLHAAVETHAMDAVQALLGKGVSLTAENQDGLSPLHLARLKVQEARINRPSGPCPEDEVQRLLEAWLVRSERDDLLATMAKEPRARSTADTVPTSRAAAALSVRPNGARPRL